MRTRKHLLVAVLIAFATSVCITESRHSFAKDPEFLAPPGFRIGMELELVPDAFANLTRYFDYDRLQAEQGATITSKLPSDFWDDYLRDYPEALSKLPESLRQTLTQGLQLESSVIHKDQASHTVLLDKDGNPLTSDVKISLPHKPAATKPPTHDPTPTRAVHAEDARLPVSAQVIQKQGELLVPKNLAWQTLYDRWKALDPSVKQSIVRWENLSSRKKAILAIKYANGNIHTKSNLPPEETELFSRLSWSRDGNAIEFRHRTDLVVSDPSVFFHDVRFLAQRAGVEGQILNPQDHRLRVVRASLHFHISVQDKDLSVLGKAFNRLGLIRLIHLGILDDLKKEGNHLYDPEAKRKGLVRVIDLDHVEFRDHNSPLKEELGFILKTLNLDTHQALKLIDAEIKTLMSDHVVDSLAQYHSSYLADFAEYMTLEQKNRVRSAFEMVEYFDRATKERPKDFFQLAPSFLASKDASVRSRTLSILQMPSNLDWPKEFWEHLASLMTSADDSLRLSIQLTLERHPTWPKEFWKHVPSFMTSPNTKVQMAILTALAGQSHWPKEVWDHIPALMKSTDISVQRTALFQIGNQSNWPKEVWDLVPTFMKSTDTSSQAFAAISLNSQSTWPKEVWDLVPALMTSTHSSVQANIVFSLTKMPTWPQEVWDRVPALMMSTDLNIQRSIAFALADKTNWPKAVWDHIPALLASTNESVRQAISFAIRNQPPNTPGRCILQEVSTHLR